MLGRLLGGAVSKTNLTKTPITPMVTSIRTNFNMDRADHTHGIEQMQYLKFKRKPLIKEESDNIAVLEDNDMLSVYLIKKVRRIQTTPDNPIYVPSLVNTRWICCHCDLEGLDLTYTILEKGEVTECECGYHFKLIDQLEPFSKRN